MLAKARQVLVGELALADGTDDAKADAMYQEAQEAIVRHRAKLMGEDDDVVKKPGPSEDSDFIDLDEDFDD